MAGSVNALRRQTDSPLLTEKTRIFREEFCQYWYNPAVLAHNRLDQRCYALQDCEGLVLFRTPFQVGDGLDECVGCHVGGDIKTNARKRDDKPLDCCSYIRFAYGLKMTKGGTRRTRNHSPPYAPQGLLIPKRAV